MIVRSNFVQMRAILCQIFIAIINIRFANNLMPKIKNPALFNTVNSCYLKKNFFFLISIACIEKLKLVKPN